MGLNAPPPAPQLPGSVCANNWQAFQRADLFCAPMKRNNAMAGIVTIASFRAHGVRQLLVYCFGKREGGWTCHHQGKLPIDQFQADEVLQDSKQQAPQQSVGWMMPPTK